MLNHSETSLNIKRYSYQDSVVVFFFNGSIFISFFRLLKVYSGFYDFKTFFVQILIHRHPRFNSSLTGCIHRNRIQVVLAMPCPTHMAKICLFPIKKIIGFHLLLLKICLFLLHFTYISWNKDILH